MVECVNLSRLVLAGKRARTSAEVQCQAPIAVLTLTFVL